MIIQTGLCDGMVLQRTRDNTCDTAVAGTCAGAGRLVARVRRNGRIVPGFGARPIGHAARGRLEGRLRGLPAGGPYDIELALAGAPGAAPERAVIRNVRVGDLWILGGQSNMEGIGRLEDAAKPDPGVRAFYMNDVWAVARDPLHNLSQATDAIHHELGTARRPGIGTGPGVAFGQAMAQASGVPQGLIACAHGGSSMAQWDPALKRKGGGSLYGALLRRFRKNGGRVAGVVWYQGCSDTAPAQAALYTRRMRRLVRASRRDLNDPRLPWAIVQIAGVYNKGWNSAGWNSVQDQQRRLPETIPHCAVVPAIDLAFDDGIHISGKDQQRLGRRLAQAMRVLRGDRRAGRPPIALRSVRCANGRIVVTYNNVMGRLQTAGRPTGFLLADPHPASIIYRAELKGNRVILYPSVLETQRQSVSLYYGYGLAPYCNITDSADRSLPAMTWVNVEYQRYVMSPFVQTWQVSRLADPARPAAPARRRDTPPAPSGSPRRWASIAERDSTTSPVTPGRSSPGPDSTPSSCCSLS